MIQNFTKVYTENIILVDWLTFTTRIWSEIDLISLFCLDSLSWEHFDSYRYGYSHRMTYNGISILSGGREDMGICIEMSGQGCRTFETFSRLSWDSVFSILSEPLNEFKVTRLDLAFDDHTDVLDMSDLLDYTDSHYYKSRSRWWLVEYGSCGTSIYHGSPQSNFRVRIYDKAAERGLLDGTHWIRVEIVLRDSNASGAISAILVSNIGKVFSGLLSNYLVYLTPSTDSNKSRWSVAPFWAVLLCNVGAIHVSSRPGLDYNIFRLESYLKNQCGGAIYTWLQINGLDALGHLIKTRNSKLNPKHKLLLDQFLGDNI